MATSPHLELELEKGGSPLTTTGPGELVAVLHKSYSTTNERIPKGEKPHCYNGPSSLPVHDLPQAQRTENACGPSHSGPPRVRPAIHVLSWLLRLGQ